MKSISASIVVLAGAILVATAATVGAAPRDSWIIAGGLGVLLLLVGLITWFGSLGRGPLHKE